MTSCNLMELTAVAVQAAGPVHHTDPLPSRAGEGARPLTAAPGFTAALTQQELAVLRASETVGPGWLGRRPRGVLQPGVGVPGHREAATRTQESGTSEVGGRRRQR